jgi:hypothetical protein
LRRQCETPGSFSSNKHHKVSDVSIFLELVCQNQFC